MKSGIDEEGKDHSSSMILNNAMLFMLAVIDYKIFCSPSSSRLPELPLTKPCSISSTQESTSLINSLLIRAMFFASLNQCLRGDNWDFFGEIS